MPLVVVDRVSKSYQAGESFVAALVDVSFALEAGEFVALRGPSGCGKSTLLHLLGAMDRPSQGSVQLEGVDLAPLRADELAAVRRRQVGFVFQSFFLLPTLRVIENVMLPLLLDGSSPYAARQRAEPMLERVGLTPRLNHFPTQLSGGEMQRAAVARALCHRPRLLLADEPTGNLDAHSGQQVMELLADVNREFGVTIVLATHAEEAAAFARRTIHLRDGKMIDRLPQAGQE
jgi:putative ABC transport system ATP-binding protein